MKRFLKKLKGLVILFLLFLLGGYISRNVVGLVKVSGNSMEPLIESGTILVVNRLGLRTGRIEVGDVVVADFEGTNIVKRVLARGGDRVVFRGDVLFVNGKRVDEWYLKEELRNPQTYKSSYEKGLLNQAREYIVPKDSYFLLGDNREESVDSRYWGALSEENIKGEVYGSSFESR